jgi:hypothetical protein
VDGFGATTARGVRWKASVTIIHPVPEADMTRTPTLPRRRLTSRTVATRPATERVLRDVAFVLALTRRVGDEIRSAGRPRTA